ncbi:MAG TPA: CBS domain-containing protein [Thermoanaerobaculia bacterium]|nr:CBS domain-containing protein [Thermoanaerobaculia bacterium]
MKVSDIMRREARTCFWWNDLAAAGRTMAEVECGVLPVLNELGQVMGMITDRDICLAVTSRDAKPSALRAGELLNGDLYTCAPDQEIHEALWIMQEFGVRRLPVVDETNRLEGILSLDDVALVAQPLGPEDYTGPFYSDIARTLKGICAHPLPAVVS